MCRQCAEGKVCRFKRLMAYRLASGLAEFNTDYQCIDGSLYDSDSYGAISEVSFDQMKKGGQFHIHPGIVDELPQSAGFVMNGPVEQVENEWAPSLDVTL
ncbi:conidial yellow pigment biosynthesis polyketide synthase [Apiospora sp. TS-2023a]